MKSRTVSSLNFRSLMLAACSLSAPMQTNACTQSEETMDASSALALQAQSPAPTGTASTTQDSADALAQPAQDLLNRLRRLQQLDFPAELVALGMPALAEGGLLAVNGEAHALVARALFDGGEEEASAKLLGAALSTAERPWLELEQARQLLQRDQLQQVLDLLLTRSGARYPVRHAQLPESWLYAARALARSGSLQNAAPLCEEFLRLAPLHPDADSAWHLLASRALELRDSERARQCMERGSYLSNWNGVLRARRLQVERTPNDPLPRLGLALTWMEVKQFDRAQPHLEQLVQEHPDFARGWFHLGEIRRMAGDFASAGKCYDRTLIADPGHGPSRYNRALLHLQVSRPEQAKRDFEVLVENGQANQPELIGTYLNLARIHLAAGRTDAAQANYALYRDKGGTQPLEAKAQ